MPIPSAETDLVIEKMQRAAIEQAFIELAVQFAATDRRRFKVVMASIETSARNFIPDPKVFSREVEAASVDFDLAHQSGVDRTVDRLRHLAQSIFKRLR